jgi:hypothetical protein
MSTIASNTFGAPVFLKSGIYIRPPAGWKQLGWIVDENPLQLLPKSRVSWQPQSDGVSLHWEVSMTPLPVQAMDALVNILRTMHDRVAIEILQPLFPALIRMSLSSITSAKVIRQGAAGPMLSVEYWMPDEQMAGVVWYAPTELYEYGEYHELAYEGSEPEYSDFVAAAVAAMETFGDPQLETISPVPPLVPTADIPVPAAPELATIPTVPTPPSSPPEVHVIQPGETVSTVVKLYWPHLDAESTKARVGEVYLFNLKKRNPIVAWDLPPGTCVFLPPMD